MFLPGDCGAPHALAASEHERAIAQRPCGERADDRVAMQPRPATTTSTREPSTTTRLSRWVERSCQIVATAFESSAFNRTQPPFRRIVLCFLKRRLLSAQVSPSKTSPPPRLQPGKGDGVRQAMMADQAVLGVRETSSFLQSDRDFRLASSKARESAATFLR